MMPTHNHERTAMASKLFLDTEEVKPPHRAAAQPAPRLRPLDQNAEGAHHSGPPPPSSTAPIPRGTRCKIKGCIYPATEVEAGLCLCHAHMEEEPQFFQSRQPSLRLQEAAIYGLTTQNEDIRIQRLRDLMAMRQLFLKGVA
jgi:hypothetical protein